MLYFERGSESENISKEELKSGLFSALEKMGKRSRVMAIPPDYTRFHSQAGIITEMCFEYFGDRLAHVLPALGTHSPMSEEQLSSMLGTIPRSLIRVHNFREDLVTLGRVPGEFMAEVSEGKLDYDWPAQVNRLLVDGGCDLILSIGQVVPHEVIGMANYNKNIFIGTGGSEGINKSHFLGAVYGMERIMGRADNPVRRVINYASEHFATDLPIVYVQTVVALEENNNLAIKGLYIGDDEECFLKASELSLKVNFNMMDEEIDKVVVFLDPSEFKSTWLGNKSVYRTRMVIADGGELVVLAPGVREFGEDSEIDKLIRKYGYVNTPAILDAVEKNEDIKGNLSAAAHLIHGSSEERFNITYCPGHLTREEIEGVNFRYADLDETIKRYDPKGLRDGWNELPDGEKVYFISNPALVLWSYKDRFK